MTMHSRIIMGMLSGAGNIAVKTALNILLIPVLIYHLGVDSYGLFVLLIGILEISTMLDLGFTAAMVKGLGEYRHAKQVKKAQELLTMGHVLYGFLAVLLCCVGWGWSQDLIKLFHVPGSLMQDAHTALLIAIAEGAMTLYTTYYRSVLLVHCQHQWVNLSESLGLILSTGIGLLLVASGQGLIALMICRLVTVGLRTIVLIFQAHRVEPSVLLPQECPSRRTVSEVITTSFHAMMVNLSIVISHKIDTFVIAAFLPIKMVGYFEIVYRFLSVASQVAGKVAEVVFPLFSRYAAEGQDHEMRYLFLRMSCVLNFTVGILILGICIFYPELFRIFSAGKIPFEPTLPILVLAIPCIWSGVLQLPSGYYLFVSGRQRYLTLTSILAAVFNLGFSLLLIKPLGMPGVILGTLIPQLIQHQAGLIRQTCKGLGISFKAYFEAVYQPNIFPLVGTVLWLLMAKTVIFSPSLTFWPVAFVLASGLVFGTTLWLAYCMNDHEKMYVEVNFVMPLQKKLGTQRPSNDKRVTHG